MDTSIRELLEEVRSLIRSRREHPQQPQVHLHKVHNVRHRLSRYSEETTPKPALSDMYTCVGRLKFYPDNVLFMYLEVSNNPGDNQPLWPVKATWKIELIDDDDCSRTHLIGDNSFIFNKPRQGFMSVCNDWISLRLDDLEHMQLIGHDGSVTIKWSVIAVPALEYEYLEQLEDLILRIDLNNDPHDLGLLQEILRPLSDEISGLQESVRNLSENIGRSFSKVNDHLIKHSGQISDLERSIKKLDCKNNVHTS